ncbi:ABC transporter permease [Bosea sp. BK604]|uniref:ABC transporter permease n=1 Tax=Bosea sp. BK604 TaxID=2512180 RepID=UPI00104F24B1|nr:ABC transporter permease [Bosea sp. BK604]TCR61812.1 putative spermidine/putrescine transport system permease protein [Bosea sp. BK604]
MTKLVMTRRLASFALLAPPLFVSIIFFIVPLGLLFWVSIHGSSSSELYSDQITAENYIAIISDSFYLTIVQRTLGAGATILALCLVFGYATAYVLAPLSPRARLWLLLLLSLPLLVSNVVRAYGWLTLLGRQGLVNVVLQKAGAIDAPLVMLNTFQAVAFALMTIMLPYMVISICNALATIDSYYREAAQSLRANPFQTFVHVTWPLSSPGVASGMLLVFLMSLSAYVAIVLLGGPRMKLLVSLIFDSAATFRWPLAAAMSFVLLAIALVVCALILMVLRPQRVQGRG